ncbi:hypothetical protein LX66_4869 [Chitinophaga japonensis]|uniref:PH (Pleckstrin Homology) domain-containing protein n=2 Tax=Chitinophaga japonensis TaxID=104662 RepID=A0A562ST80_CHIJA|nr:hypothetical protein LX66_4869 [Chitinophaga japonensis]
MIILVLELLISVAATVLIFMKEPDAGILVALLPALFGIALFLLMTKARLKLEINDQEIHYQFRPFHLSRRTITRSQVDALTVVSYDPLSDYGGWGIRKGREGWAYTTAGHTGLLIKRNNGKPVLIGTSRPDALAAFLRSRWTALYRPAS